MAFENIIYEKKDKVGWITVNRPEAMNVLNMATVLELEKAIDSIEEDEDVWMAILTGAGEKSFVAGADIPEFMDLTPDGARDYARRGQKLMNLIDGLGKPVIAAVKEYASGGGCEIAVACTIRIA